MFMIVKSGSGGNRRFGGGRLRRLGQPRRAEHAIGLDDLLQTLLGAPIAAVCVGMIPLHEFLISRLYLLQRRGSVKVQYIQCAFLHTRHATLWRSWSRLLGRVPENAKVVLKRRGSLALARPSPAFAQRPGRAVSDHGGISKCIDLTFAHPAEVVPGFIMVARMFQAEPEMLVQLLTRLWNPIAAFPNAIRTRAGPNGDLWLRTIRLDPN